MKIDMNKTYRTRDGREVRIYSTEAGGNFPVHGAVRNKLGRWEHHGWTAHGLWSALYINSPNDLDLVEVRPERVVWINEYEDSVGAAAPSRARADQYAGGKNRVALHRVVLGPDTEVKDA